MLECQKNQLTSLDVSHCTGLWFLNCSSNLLTGLNVSNNLDLWEINCADNQLTHLNLSNNTALLELKCQGNQLSSLDISKNISIGSVSSDPPELDLSQMPTLYQVCVWELPFPPAGVEIDTTGSPNVFFTMDCI